MDIFLSACEHLIFLNINMQMKDGNRPPENEQGVTLVLFNTITELVACAVCYSKKNKKKTQIQTAVHNNFLHFFNLAFLLKLIFRKTYNCPGLHFCEWQQTSITFLRLQDKSESSVFVDSLTRPKKVSDDKKGMN